VVLTVLGAVGSALTPTLAVRHPLLLIALEARDRNLLLARHVAFVPFLVLGTVRRLASDPFFYLLGRHHGDAGVRWLERHGGGALVRWTERAFRRAAYAMLILFPGAVVCALAGDVGIPVKTFSILIVVRTVVAVVLIRMLGNALATPIDDVLRFFDRWTLTATVASGAAVALYLLWEHLRSRRRRAMSGDEKRERAS
jgi:membrane protein DedA with SNARE-associated domain